MAGLSELPIAIIKRELLSRGLLREYVSITSCHDVVTKGKRYHDYVMYDNGVLTIGTRNSRGTTAPYAHSYVYAVLRVYRVADYHVEWQSVRDSLTPDERTRWWQVATRAALSALHTGYVLPPEDVTFAVKNPREGDNIASIPETTGDVDQDEANANRTDPERVTIANSTRTAGSAKMVNARKAVAQNMPHVLTAIDDLIGNAMDDSNLTYRWRQQQIGVCNRLKRQSFPQVASTAYAVNLDISGSMGNKCFAVLEMIKPYALTGKIKLVLSGEGAMEYDASLTEEQNAYKIGRGRSEVHLGLDLLRRILPKNQAAHILTITDEALTRDTLNACREAGTLCRV